MREGDVGRCGQEAVRPGSDAVRRALRVEIARAAERSAGQRVRVLDVGGGSGVWAVPLAVAGCQVTVVDTSLNALAALSGRAREAGVADRVTAIQADVQALTDVVPAAGADLVLGHGLLEVVDDVESAVAQLAEATSPDGAVSVLVAGRYGAALALAHAGRAQQARAVLTDPDGRSGPSDPLQRRLDVAGLRELLDRHGRLAVELIQGDGMFEGWLPGAVLQSAGGPGDVVELVELFSRTPELLVLAARLHVIARRVPPCEKGHSPG